MSGTPKSTGTARYFWCRLGPVPLCWTCGNVYYKNQDCFCGRMPSICKHHNIRSDPMPRPEYCQPWDNCQTGHAAAGDGVAGGTRYSARDVVTNDYLYRQRRSTVSIAKGSTRTSRSATLTTASGPLLAAASTYAPFLRSMTPSSVLAELARQIL